MWDKDLKFGREIAIHKDYAVIAMVVNNHKQLYSCGRDGTLRFFRRPWSHDTNDTLLQTVMDDVTALTIYDDTLYSGDDKGIVTKWYHNQVGCQYNVMEEVKSLAVEGLYNRKSRNSLVFFFTILFSMCALLCFLKFALCSFRNKIEMMIILSLCHLNRH